MPNQLESNRSERTRAASGRGWIVAESPRRVSARRRAPRAAAAAAGLCANVLAIPPADADALSLELGGGNLRSHGDALFLSWRRPAPVLFGRASHYELALAAWSGPDANEAFTLSRGMRFCPGGYALAASAGIGYVAERTSTHLQFVVRLALGRAYGDYELALAQRHYSNGQLLFGWSGPNRGENFLGIELARRF